MDPVFLEAIDTPILIRLKLQRDERPVRGILACVPRKHLPRLEEAPQDFLADSELNQLEKMTKYIRRKQTFLMGRYALKVAACAFTGTKNLKKMEVATAVVLHPLVKYPLKDIPEVTLSHTDTLAVAIAHEAGHIMGIDIEKADTKKLSVYEREMSAQEEVLLRNSQGKYEVLANMLWTIKEAMSKAIKVGFMTPFKFMEIKKLSKQKERCYLSFFKNFAHFKCYSYVLENHIVSIVLPIKTKLTLDLNRLYPEKL